MCDRRITRRLTSVNHTLKSHVRFISVCTRSTCLTVIDRVPRLLTSVLARISNNSRLNRLHVGLSTKKFHSYAHITKKLPSV